MIISIWKPKYKVIDKKLKIFLYGRIDDLNILKEKGTSNYKVIWTCDDKECNFKDKLHSIDNYHLNKSEKCNLEIQICKSCQTKGSNNPRYGDRRKWSDFFNEEELRKIKHEKSEKWKHHNISKMDEVKTKKGQIIINFDNVQEKLNLHNYKLISLDGNNKNCNIEIICPNNHKYKTKYNRFFFGHKNRCKECYYDSLKSSIQYTNEYEYYKKLVTHYTNKSYRKYKNIINPNNLKRSRKYHLDHKYSIYEGFTNGILPTIIGSYHNLEVITSDSNLSKNKKSSITLEQLLNNNL